MFTRTLGKSEIEVSAMGLGTWAQVMREPLGSHHS